MFDRDVVGSDDFMGRAEFDLTECELGKPEEATLHLQDGGDEELIRKNKKKKSLGWIVVRMVLTALSKEEYNEVSDDYNFENGKNTSWELLQMNLCRSCGQPRTGGGRAGS